MDSGPSLEFEREVYQLEVQLAELEKQTNRTAEDDERIRQLRNEVNEALRTLYSNLDPWQTVQVSPKTI